MAGSAKSVERLGSAVNQLIASVTAIVADVELIRAALVAHTHDGVTVGAGVTGASTAATVATVATAATMTGFGITQRYTFN